MKTFGRRNVRKQIEIKGSDNYVTLEISLKFDSLDNMRIKSSKPKNNLGRSGKGLNNSLGLKAKVRPKKYKKSRYAIVSASKKNLSKIIREFDKLPYNSYDRRRTKHESTDSYFYLARQISKCMMISDVLNLHIYHVRTEITATKQIPISHICSTGESTLKEFQVNENLSHICSTDECK